ncbi:MAG: hypothetical protein AAF333_03230 [Planctomycetota bacterium]
MSIRASVLLFTLFLLTGCQTSGNDGFPESNDALNLAAGLDTLRSNLYIPANESFVLGGGQPQGFKVLARNVGPVEVRLNATGDDADRKVILGPNGELQFNIPAGKAALLTNRSDSERAHLKVVILTPKQNLGMTYQPANGL